MDLLLYNTSIGLLVIEQHILGDYYHIDSRYTLLFLGG